jgi:hemoglobin
MNSAPDKMPQLKGVETARPNTLAPVISNPHYQMAGGEQGIHNLVEQFYALMDTLPQARAIRAMHPADLSHAKQRLFMFLSGWLGGPPLYEECFGHPRLRQKHISFPISEAERDAWMLCMTLALDEVIEEPALRTQLTQSFFKTADFLRNL